MCPLIERENKKVVSKATQRKPPPEVWGGSFSFAWGGSVTVSSCERPWKEFQFPPNGKAYPKDAEEDRRAQEGTRVSIPSERESISKVYGNVDFIDESNVFQFPPNGKAYPKNLQSNLEKLIDFEAFQFPPNGKAYPKTEVASELNRNTFFMFQFPPNGKAYPKGCCPHTSPTQVRCFNSLRTGKHIQSVKLLRRKRHCNNLFQFPPNGKAYPKEP